MNLSAEDQTKQELYRDARFTDRYNDIWQSVGKCVFCDLREKYVFFEENGITMSISLYAYIDGHFMIIPRRHVRSPRELSQIEWDTVRKFTYIAKKLIKDTHGINGVQFIDKEGSDAQSTVTDHWHLHCVPFDAPDLAVWNYRKLKNTPLENVQIYKQARKKIVSYEQKFEQKYQNFSGLPIGCDAIIVNNNNEILFEERTDGVKLSPDTMTIPGGHVTDFHNTLEEELVRELHEELGITFDPARFNLLASRIDNIKYSVTEPHIKVKFDREHRFLWNTYYMKGFDSTTPLTPGDDCQEIVWVPASEVKDHPRISQGIKDAVKKLPL